MFYKGVNKVEHLLLEEAVDLKSFKRHDWRKVMCRILFGFNFQLGVTK